MVKHSEGLPVYKKEHLEKIEIVCLSEETIRAVFDTKGVEAGFLGITDNVSSTTTKLF